MSRRGISCRRSVGTDSVYNSKLVARLINKVMLDGKKTIAQHIVFTALANVGEKLGMASDAILMKVMTNVMPTLEVKARRVGGATYQVPVEVRAARRQTLGLRWLVNFSRQRSERTMIERLTNELVDAFNKTGGSVKKREDVHKMADANKAFAHYRW
ncbi:MAG: 30S ribosomal protein S7 [Candidatus Improbicoccus devescovinae]|nr:MAG: 30S ribosomal protein S7 [Candidatus Improbicoccus devescovinae]